MDNLSKLQALLGEDQVATGEEEDNPWAHVKNKYLYEGSDTDSNDDEYITSGRGARKSTKSSDGPSKAAGETSTSRAPATAYAHREPTPLNLHQLTLGQLAPQGELFVPWLTVKKYPYDYVGVTNRQAASLNLMQIRVVAEDFFDQGKVFERTWDFFYIHREGTQSNLPAILLVPTPQLEALLIDINEALDTHLTIPSGAWGRVFQIAFDDNDGTPRPRYLGRSTSKAMAENLRTAIPPVWYKVPGELANAGTPSQRSLEAFKAKIDLMAQAANAKKVASKEKQKADRIAKQQSWSHLTKRVQRYLGLRQASREKADVEAVIANWRDPELYAPASALSAHEPRTADFNPDIAAPYNQEDDVVFVCVDVEANEKIPSQITEIGIATLDTRDLKTLVPGERGVNWQGKIRARHFRIDEYKHVVNREYVRGCPGSFEKVFGESEFIKLRDAAKTVASCFKPPFSDPDENVIFDEDAPKRNIVLVGHSIGADIIYLRKLGYDVHNLSNLQELVDTAVMWQALKRDNQPRSLGSVLAELDIIGWNLHNAGNDAAYTLQAMIGISVRQLLERAKLEEERNLEKKSRVEESIKEATQNALEREEGWSSGGEDSDGGAPISPVPSGTKKPLTQQAGISTQYSQGPWRNPPMNAANASLNQRNDGSWQPVATSSSRTTLSSGSWRGQNTSRQGPIRGVNTPTALVQSANSNSKAIIDLANKTTLFTIESDTISREH